jgi:Domain of unknown function (DUF4832)/Domain of unknown function (DUF4874)/Secretion system C-terminal sorting domain
MFLLLQFLKNWYYKPLLLLMPCVFFLSINIAAQTTIPYTASSLDITNPDRGFYRHRQTFTASATSNNLADPLTLSDLNTIKSSENKTIILRLYYIGKYKASAIHANYLAGIQTDLNIARNAGFRVLLRFAYSNTNATPQPHRHNLDASMTQVLAHIEQLKPIIKANRDVIAVLQAGFIGTYGEWYYTHPDFSTDNNGTPNYVNRKRVMDSLLSMMAPDRMVQIRTPYYKQNIYGTGATGTAAAITPAQAYTGTSLARTGHFNDCFAASPDDIGTYSNITEDKNYLEAETKYLPNGGETCTDDWFGTAPAGTYSNCISVQNELQRFHFSYLNNDYNGTVLNRWGTENCFNTIKSKLGYRLTLQDGTFTNTGKPGYTFITSINIINSGYAAPYNKRNVQLILKNTSSGTLYPLNLITDERLWLPGSTHTVNIAAGIGNIANGNYNLYLNIHDTATAIASNAAYSIRFANTGTWEAATGYNLLGTFNINTSNNPGTAVYTGSNWFGTATVLNIKFADVSIVCNGEKGNTIKWEAAENDNNAFYEIQKSTDQYNYTAIGKVIPTATLGTVNYQFADADMAANHIFYRIRQVDKNGSFIFSKIVGCRHSKINSNQISLYPNPVVDDKCTVQIFDAVQGEAIIQIYNQNGGLVYQAVNVLKNGNNQVVIKPLSNLSAGNYVMKINIENESIIKKFIKN